MEALHETDFERGAAGSVPGKVQEGFVYAALKRRQQQHQDRGSSPLGKNRRGAAEKAKRHCGGRWRVTCAVRRKQASSTRACDIEKEGGGQAVGSPSLSLSASLKTRCCDTPPPLFAPKPLLGSDLSMPHHVGGHVLGVVGLPGQGQGA